MQADLPERLLIHYARRFPIRRGKLRTVNSLWRWAAGSRGTQRIASLKHGGFKMPCDLREMLQRQFYFFGTYFMEEEILDCWEKEARDAKVIFDVGANAGIFSIAALAVHPGAEVHAFEPTPEIAARLRETAAMNQTKRIHVHEVAVSREDGHATLKRYRGDLGTNEGMNYISSAQAGADHERVVTVSIDRFCADRAIERIDLMKLDIQGNEHLALSGASGMLGAGRIGTLFTELNWARDAGSFCPASESIRLLGEAGYGFAVPESGLHWKKAGDWMRGLGDVVARRMDTGMPA